MTRKEAINVVKNNWPDSSYTRLREALETLIPELKESEDEKVRKWLIEMVEEVRKANPTNAEHNGMCSEAIAWLEKQSEQKPADDLKTWRNIVDEVLTRFVGIGQYLDSSLATTIAKDLQKKYSLEHKPTEWSEEDEKNYNAIIRSLEFSYEEGIDLNGIESHILFDWLKSLKPQPNWKPSEEQMRALRHCCDGWQDNADGCLESLYSDLQKL